MHLLVAGGADDGGVAPHLAHILALGLLVTGVTRLGLAALP